MVFRVRFGVRVRVRSYSHSREVRFSTRPYRNLSTLVMQKNARVRVRADGLLTTYTGNFV